jgi:molybdopterin converting factor small subunit
MAVQEMEVAPMEEPVAIPVEQKPVAMPEPAAEIAPEPEPVAAMPVPEPIPAVKEPEATEMPSTPAMIVTDKPMPTLYVEPAEAPTDETPWEEILPPAADPTYAQSVQNTEVITSPGYKYDWLFADEETRAKMSTPDPSSPEERMAELDKILAEEIDEFTADFNEAYAKDDEDFVPAVEDALPVMTAEDAIEHVDQLFAETALDDDAPGVVIQEEEGDEMLQNESEEGLFGDVSYQDERELLSDLYSLLGEEQEIDEHMDVIEDAGELEDATSVLRQEIEERHELMGMFDDMNQEIEDLATRLEEGSTAAPVYRDTPEEPARTVDGNAGKIRDAREEDRSISPRAGQLIIELSKEDLAKIIQSSINTSMLEGLVKDAVQASLEKIVPALTEKIVREELRLIGDR